MTRPTSSLIVLVSAPGTLPGIDSFLERAGFRFGRVSVLESHPLPPGRWLKELGRGPRIDTILVTSRIAVGAGVVPWRATKVGGADAVEFWAVGPATAEALGRLGVRRVRQARTPGGAALVAALDRPRPRSILYLRSNRAGPDLARHLRARGHAVIDRIVYRVEGRPRLNQADSELAASAELLVVTSPSGLSALRRGLGQRAFDRLRRTTRLVVLGPRSRHAARGHGFRHVSVVPPTTAQRFTHRLLRELRNGQT
jgi:uroporphyrinogen-III synthase